MERLNGCNHDERDGELGMGSRPGELMFSCDTEWSARFVSILLPCREGLGEGLIRRD